MELNKTMKNICLTFQTLVTKNHLNNDMCALSILITTYVELFFQI
jgi:hypothetical protein